MTSTAPVLLSHRALGLGDLLTAVPALRALRRALPDHRHVHVTSTAMAPLASLLDAVDEVLPAGAVGDLAPLARAPGPVDVAVGLHGRGPQSHRVLQRLRPGRLIAFDQPEADHRGPAWRADEHEVHRWCRLLQTEGIPADPADLHIDPPGGPVHPDAPGCTVIHPGAASAARRWPAARFAAVAAQQRDEGRVVLVTGSPAEQPLAARVARDAGLPGTAVLAGGTDLVDLVRTVAAADRVVCGDTGVAHLATAVRTPSVVLFGPTPPAWWGPPAHLAERHRVLWSGRTGDPHGDAPDPGLLQLTPADVIAALSDLPAGSHRTAVG